MTKKAFNCLLLLITTIALTLFFFCNIGHTRPEYDIKYRLSEKEVGYRLRRVENSEILCYIYDMDQMRCKFKNNAPSTMITGYCCDENGNEVITGGPA